MADTHMHMAIQQILQPLQAQVNHNEFLLKQLFNYTHGSGTVVNYIAVPFIDGTDPTSPQIDFKNGLPLLYSLKAVDDLDPQYIVPYLTGYGYGGQNQPPLPVGEDDIATLELRKDLLKKTIACRYH